MYFIVMIETLLCWLYRLSTCREVSTLFPTQEIMTTMASPENGMSDCLSQFDGKFSSYSFCF